MNKKEAAAHLGVSTRLIERYDAEGRLGEKTYVRGKTGKQADWPDEAVERLRAELEAPTYPATALQTLNSQRIGLVAPEDRDRFIRALEAISEERRNRRVPIIDLAAKYLLTLSEASTLSGLSKNHLSNAIRSGKLKAKKIGRGWKIKPANLKAYADKL